MKITISKEKLKGSLLNLMRRCGYKPQYQTLDRKIFIRCLTNLNYPRFHIYAEEKKNDYELSLHLDQKKPVYRGSASHQGEYNGPMVEEELKRIKNILLL